MQLDSQLVVHGPLANEMKKRPAKFEGRNRKFRRSR